MSASFPWGDLELPGPSDVATVRRAYARLAKRIRPDDDADGFQALRRAYESALERAKRAADDAGSAAAGSPIRPSGHAAATGSTTERHASPAERAEAGVPIERSVERASFEHRDLDVGSPDRGFPFGAVDIAQAGASPTNDGGPVAPGVTGPRVDERVAAAEPGIAGGGGNAGDGRIDGAGETSHRPRAGSDPASFDNPLDDSRDLRNNRGADLRDDSCDVSLDRLRDESRDVPRAPAQAVRAAAVVGRHEVAALEGAVRHFEAALNRPGDDEQREALRGVLSQAALDDLVWRERTTRRVEASLLASGDDHVRHALLQFAAEALDWAERAHEFRRHPDAEPLHPLLERLRREAEWERAQQLASKPAPISARLRPIPERLLLEPFSWLLFARVFLASPPLWTRLRALVAEWREQWPELLDRLHPDAATRLLPKLDWQRPGVGSYLLAAMCALFPFTLLVVGIAMLSSMRESGGDLDVVTGAGIAAAMVAFALLTAVLAAAIAQVPNWFERHVVAPLRARPSIRSAWLIGAPVLLVSAVGIDRRWATSDAIGVIEIGLALLLMHIDERLPATLGFSKRHRLSSGIEHLRARAGLAVACFALLLGVWIGVPVLARGAASPSLIEVAAVFAMAVCAARSSGQWSARLSTRTVRRLRHVAVFVAAAVAAVVALWFDPAPPQSSWWLGLLGLYLLLLPAVELGSNAYVALIAAGAALLASVLMQSSADACCTPDRWPAYRWVVVGAFAALLVDLLHRPLQRLRVEST